MVPNTFIFLTLTLLLTHYRNCSECNGFSASTILNSAVMVDIWGTSQRTWDSVPHSTMVGSICYFRHLRHSSLSSPWEYVIWCVQLHVYYSLVLYVYILYVQLLSDVIIFCQWKITGQNEDSFTSRWWHRKAIYILKKNARPSLTTDKELNILIQNNQLFAGSKDRVLHFFLV